jgi:uncharacterized membrane protein
MVTFETTDRKLARRFRVAQFHGRTATYKSDGSMVSGHVRSVLQNKAGIPARWTITIVPCAPIAKVEPLRTTSYFYAFAEDFYERQWRLTPRYRPRPTSAQGNR